MFNTHGKQSIALDNWGGLITEAPPETLPEGASPLCYDVDFPIAAVSTRPGLQSQLSNGTNRNFVYVKTLQTTDGVLRTLCLDSSGELWIENVTANPGVLTAITSPLFTAGDQAKSSTAFNREYICLSDPAGVTPDTPWQYNAFLGQFDRVSQEGPGANATYVVPAAATNQAAITSFAIASNVVTFQAIQGFTAGELVAISGLTTGTYLNGQILTVLAAGLSGTQFEANFTHANVTSVTDSGAATPVTSFAISTITQPAATTVVNTGAGAFQWSAGPDSTNAGSVITVYYKQNAADTLLTTQFQKGIPVYIYLTGAPSSFAQFNNGTFQVTSIGSSPGGGGPWYFFTFQAPSVAKVNQAQSGAAYQITYATVTTSSPVPGVVIGSQISIQGATPTAWNNTWSVVDTPQSGVMNVNQTSLTSGVATYNFTLLSGNNPVVGDLVTVKNTTNGNGVFNVINAPVTATGAGTFSVSFAGAQTPANIAAQAETGSAQTAGKIFNIDPGALTAGLTNANSPIYGNDSGTGQIVSLGSTLNIGAGTRQAVVLFQTRNNYITKPSPPVTFTTNGLQQQIVVTNIPIGPPNVIARIIAFTEAGANGIPGAFFYYIPIPVQSIVNGQPFTYSSTVVLDNTSTTATFTFTDAVLLASTEIDVPGNDLFAVKELGNSRWNIQYAGRMFYGLEQNKVPNFNNLTFNGGFYANPDGTFPAGWTADGTNGAGVSLIASSDGDGQSYYVLNNTGSTQSLYGMITQSAFQDAYGVPILLQNTLYSVRLRARIPSGNTTGNLQIMFVPFDKLTGYNTTLAQTVTVPFSSLSTTMKWLNFNIVTTAYGTVPSNLVYRIAVTNVANGADLELGRTEIYPTQQPSNLADVAVSYFNQPEAIDVVTGKIGLSGRNPQPANGAFVMYDILYFLKSQSLFSTRSSTGDEPVDWNVSEVSNRVGTASIWSYDVGEEWMVTACREGVFVFTGGAPVDVSREIKIATGNNASPWDLINWNAAYSMWCKVDINQRRIMIGAPMATPNFYLPNAPTNANPTSPNVIFMMSYVGVETPQELAHEPQMHTTMFGNLVSVDMRRKWTLWQIASPYADFVTRQDGVSKPIFICNGTGTGKIYQLNAQQFSDDGVAIDSLYTTYGFVNSGQSKQNPLLGFHRKLYTYFQMLCQGAGQLTVKFLANKINASAQYSWNVLSVLGGITLSSTGDNDDIERSINIAGNRVFIQVRTNAVGAHFMLSKAIMVGGPHPVLPLRGSASQ